MFKEDFTYTMTNIPGINREKAWRERPEGKHLFWVVISVSERVVHEAWFTSPSLLLRWCIDCEATTPEQSPTQGGNNMSQEINYGVKFKLKFWLTPKHFGGHSIPL